jgi:hypothetical protein
MLVEWTTGVQIGQAGDLGRDLLGLASPRPDAVDIHVPRDAAGCHSQDSDNVHRELAAARPTMETRHARLTTRAVAIGLMSWCCSGRLAWSERTS